MPKNLPNKKYVDSKRAELLLVSQAIESSEAKAARRPIPPPKTRQEAPQRKKSRKLDAAKLSIAQKERERRLARKKIRQAGRSAGGTSLQSNTDLQGQQVKMTAASMEHQPQRGRKRVAFT
ncbi:hypothetical protein FRC08_002727 [Ceratobasidium sp. 394]|nr:hypothetical protein FRC08_002727 [Ceratobasidium sp. 394]